VNINGIIKGYLAGAVIAAYRIVKFDSADGTVIQAAAAADKSVGVTTDIAAASGETVDVIKNGLANVEYGGNVTRGDLLTADSVGRAVTAAPSTGANVRIIGVAEVSGVSGDIGSLTIAPSMLQG
jgi:hypothetical protein